MPRKVKYKSYSKQNVKIDRISFEMEESLGNWNSYPWIKFNYFYDYKGDARYCYFIALNNYVEGYFYAQDEISKESNEYINKYDRIMVLYDLAIDHRAYSRLGKLLINHLLYLSKINGLQALVINKVDQCSFFINFIKRHYKYKESKDKIYIFINNPIKISYQDNLKVLDNEYIHIEDLYYLYDLGFKINKLNCTYKLENYKIIVDRKTGIVSLPIETIKNYKFYINDQKVKTLIHLLIENSGLPLTYINNVYNEIDAYNSNDIFIFDNIDKFSKNYQKINRLLNDYQINNVRLYNINYDFVNRYIYKIDTYLDLESILIKHRVYLDMKYDSIKEIPNIIEEIKLFNLNLDNLRRFEFKMGSSFSGIKKMLITFNEDEVELKHNNINKEEIDLNKEEIIEELKKLYFGLWNEEYINPKGKEENYWEINIELNDNTLSFKGKDNYPSSWYFVLKFINKYCGFKFDKIEL